MSTKKVTAPSGLLGLGAFAGIRFIIGLRLFREALAENKVGLAEHYGLEYGLPKDLTQKRIAEHNTRKVSPNA